MTSVEISIDDHQILIRFILTQKPSFLRPHLSFYLFETCKKENLINENMTRSYRI